VNDTTNKECEATGDTLTKNEPTVSTDTTPRKVVGIYGLQNKIKPDKWNVGQSWDIYSRWRKEYKNTKCKHQHKLYNALMKYGYDGFNKVILEELTDPTQQFMDDRENYWIKFYNSIENGYNIRESGSHGKMAR
jgi:group I intron endonuclease